MQRETRINREAWLEHAVEIMRPEFEAVGAPLPEHLAVSCSWPSGNPGTVIGECWIAEASARHYVEIFITPKIADERSPQGVLSVLVHELVHASGRRGHGSEFKALAVQFGLDGPMTATVAGDALTDYIDWVLMPQLGKYPHGALIGGGEIAIPGGPDGPPIILRPDDRPKRQGTRMLKASCPTCGYTIRLTRKWADVGLPGCPIAGHPRLALDGGEETPAEAA